MNIIEILQDCKLFSQVGAAGFQRLAAIAWLRRFHRRQIVFREAEPCPGMFIVGEGLVRIFRTGKDGHEYTLHTAGPGEFMAESTSIGATRLPATAEALAKTTWRCCR